MRNIKFNEGFFTIESRSALVGTFLLASSFCFPVCATAESIDEIDGVVVFGDSLSTSNLNDETPDLFPPSTGPVSALYHEGRMSDGNVWVDYLAESIGRSPLVPSLSVEAEGKSVDVNYAVNGARSRDNPNINGPGIKGAGFWTSIDSVWDMKYGQCFREDKEKIIEGSMDRWLSIYNLDNQVDEYLRRLGKNNQTCSRKTLYPIWIGSLDMIDCDEGFADFVSEEYPYINAKAFDFCLPRATIENVKNGIRKLHEKGAELFMVLNYPPFELMPNVISLISGKLSSVVPEFLIEHFASQLSRGDGYLSYLLTGYNYKLKEELENLESELGIIIVQVDVYTYIKERVEEKIPAGLISAFDKENCAIAPNPEEFVFTDGIHLTSSTHKGIAELAYNTLQERLL